MLIIPFGPGNRREETLKNEGIFYSGCDENVQRKSGEMRAYVTTNPPLITFSSQRRRDGQITAKERKKSILSPYTGCSFVWGLSIETFIFLASLRLCERKNGSNMPYPIDRSLRMRYVFE